ncbi:MAG: glycosyltransferase [Bacteroidota bacterium]
MKETQNKKRILITVLNWGLGHATRCLPIIRRLESDGHQVILASDGRALALLQKECPDLLCLNLPGHNIYYPKKHFMWLMAWQLPKIAWTTIAEYFRVRKIVRIHQIDTVISDNRFGCFALGCENIFMTHQLNVIIHYPIFQWLVRQLNQNWIRLFFNQYWIPDVAGVPNLSGLLAHGTRMPNPRYIGLLSRMQKLDAPKVYDWIAVLSGPEPQRTHLEKIIIEQAKNRPSQERALIIGGKSESTEEYTIREGLTYYAFVSGAMLNRLICGSHVVICRSGYSTLMDLAATGSRAILIPTPQQSEQEYLAAHLFEQQLFYTQSQADFELNTALIDAPRFSGFGDQWLSAMTTTALFDKEA